MSPACLSASRVTLYTMATCAIIMAPACLSASRVVLCTMTSIRVLIMTTCDCYHQVCTTVPYHCSLHTVISFYITSPCIYPESHNTLWQYANVYIRSATAGSLFIPIPYSVANMFVGSQGGIVQHDRILVSISNICYFVNMSPVCLCASCTLATRTCKG